MKRWMVTSMLALFVVMAGRCGTPPNDPGISRPLCGPTNTFMDHGKFCV